MPGTKQTILLLLTALTLTYLLSSPTPLHPSPSPLPGSQRNGSLTPEMLKTLTSLISNSTQIYRRYRLVDMANYISQGMRKGFGDQWQVFVFGEGTEECGFAASTVVDGHWAVWSQFGTYDLCYVVYRTKTCIKPNPSLTSTPTQSLTHPPTYQQEWGYSFTDPDKERTLALLSQASSHSGDNMTANAEYMRSRMGAGSWAIAIGGPSNGIGMSACYFRGWYAYLVDYTDLLWTYGIIREI